MSFEAIPKDLRGLRACLVCSLIKVSIFIKDCFLFLIEKLKKTKFCLEFFFNFILIIFFI